MTDLTQLSEMELQEVIDKAEKALKDRLVSKRKEVIAQIKELAASAGLVVEIHDADKFIDRKNSKVAPRFRNPADPLQTWSGRGLAPKWMQALISSGRSKSEFEIK
ncbi:H-NS histone family protein [Methylomonas sp. AM2-LC]|uniref:H-NS histone family protein n=1 Tax=Methylomonas sp. AM2-LC TaxID=3153301 RepID=UPI00326464D9